ncbi:2-amino-4-hydroxy-6-hydroxymethyldihydropteridine diphosphokinase [Candidatus Pantoea edessiphila]|uniref:2-amino-4-hydroxy-6-hydroxymethyldihydropteridine pyrophosphokinase n=1 Tax=Candidatus Pantoea edessiphila TaxID=2044610 RepID=A0A2P5SY52_9GAMM|nr:2-amino-4-hydroxy-6-hydroxymethyldihydropteridine diphosphokinase [Candidatus Pantoea edessiphila]MBK4775578.1 2-amino-4-hydroxy-6-hydroxymethyldihydropteridine diphosphokinase [Pantoea sp. Edef]PPI87230.1 2-amino-4-hydroxy-6-hydroxymethyldihydropteridine diphosphokinase [Candidatus Pantoea edessiphila]
MTIIYISLGSNLNDPIYQIKSTLIELDKIPQTKRIITSRFYITQPYGFKNQPNFINIAVEMDTKLSPESFLHFVKIIESKKGRVRNKERWGPRNIDIDIMLFGNLIINTDCLTIPHYDMVNRNFMLLPLTQIAPNITLPNNGKLIKSILDKLDISTIRILNL